MKEPKKIFDFNKIRISIASPEEILSWSLGEVTRPETINYRTQKPERDGLFCERIFGPTKDYECYCGKYKKIRYKGSICERCGVEVTKSIVRRERMGHINLAAPVVHLWYLRGTPSKVGLILDLSIKDLEKVVYFNSYIIIDVFEKEREELIKKVKEETKEVIKKIEKEYEEKIKKNKDVKTASFLEKEKMAQIQKIEKEANETLIEALSLKKGLVISELKYRDLVLKFGEIFKAGMGAEAVYKLLAEINLEKLSEELKEEIKKSEGAKKIKFQKRLRLVEYFRKNKKRPEWMVLTVLPVIPPDLRPMVQLDGGRFATSDLNDLYRRVINRNNRLRRLMEINAPEIICRNEKRMLQEAVDALIDNEAKRGKPITTQAGRKLKSLSDILRGKQGRFRQNLLGKRVDYSGRSVIVIGPNLKLNQCGLPKKVALELFKPFIIGLLIKEGYAHNVKNASRMIALEREEVWDKLEEIIKDYYVLLNRAPTLHRLGIQAFQPVLIEGHAIQIHPLVCAAYNADFDGDQMAVHVPLSDIAQWEAKEIMLSCKNILKPADGMPIVSPSQDMVLGVYYMTLIRDKMPGEGKVFKDKNEAIYFYQVGEVHLQAKIKVKIDKEIIETSVGRILFNEIIPEKLGFLNQTMKKNDLKELIWEVFNEFGLDKVVEFLDQIKNLGFSYATESGMTIAVDDIIIPQKQMEIIKEAENRASEINNQYRKGLITEREKSNKVIAIWTEARDRLEELMSETLDKYGSIYAMMDSGARGTVSQITQIAGIKGLVTNPAGKTIELPIKSNFKKGFSILEYFISMHGARKGKTDTALRTSDSGYLTRRLVDVAQDIIISQKDCGDKKGMTLKTEESDERFSERIWGRTLATDLIDQKGRVIWPKGTLITREIAKDIEQRFSSVIVFTPLTCKSDWGVCQKCYGLDLARGHLVEEGEAVGIMAAQSIGEPGTQLTMRTFHIGGIAGVDITQGLPRVEELFEARDPKYEAILAEIEGKILIKENKDQLIVEVRNPKEKKSYIIPPHLALKVKDGDLVTIGDVLSEGHINLKMLFKLKGQKAVQKYIISEIQKIYALQGQVIHDKHIEIIISRMFSKVRIKDPGDTDYLSGEVIDKSEINKVNNEVKKNNKKPATFESLILGITKAALLTSSFLSAASFQETTRVLVEAACRGAVDELRGLKENVIIGRLIPAGTGFRKDLVEKIKKEISKKRIEKEKELLKSIELEEKETIDIKEVVGAIKDAP